MKKKFCVGVREVHVRYYSVIAADPEQAKTLVSERDATAIDIEHQEYSHDLDPDTWSVEETRHE